MKMLAWLSLHTDAGVTFATALHTLQMGDGRSIPILMTHWDFYSAEFKITAPIPGFETSFAKTREGVMV